MSGRLIIFIISQHYVRIFYFRMDSTSVAVLSLCLMTIMLLMRLACSGWRKVQIQSEVGSTSEKRHFPNKALWVVSTRHLLRKKPARCLLHSFPYSEGNLLFVARNIQISMPNYKALWITLKEQREKNLYNKDQNKVKLTITSHARVW